MVKRQKLRNRETSRQAEKWGNGETGRQAEKTTKAIPRRLRYADAASKINNKTLRYLILSLETDSQMQCAVDANLSREAFARDLWSITLRTNVLFGQEWRIMTNDLLFEFQNATVENVRKGYTGHDIGVRIWTFSSALMFSLTVFTTIGKYICIFNC